MLVCAIELIRLIVSASFGLMLAQAGYEKLCKPLWFRLVLKGYGLLPGRLIPAIGTLLPAAELALGVSLLLGVPWPWPLQATGVLLAGLTGAVVINLVRGRRDIMCGCFGPDTERVLSWGLVGRNIALIVIALAVAQMPVLFSGFAPEPLFLHAAAVAIVVVVSFALAVHHELRRRRARDVREARARAYMRSETAAAPRPPLVAVRRRTGEALAGKRVRHARGSSWFVNEI